MPDRYWVGGTASWDGTAGTKWATTSGGAGGASVPTSADDVFFTNLSTGTVTIATGNTGAKSINCTGFAGTITGTAAISVAGSVTLSAGMTYTHTGTVTFTGTGTLTTSGKTFSGVVVDGTGITLTLGSALDISTRDIILTLGTFDTADYSVVAGRITSASVSVRVLLLRSSTLTLSGQFALNISSAVNLTVTPGSSKLVLTNASATLGNSASGVTLNDIEFTSTAIGTRGLSGSSTQRDVTVAAPSSDGIIFVRLFGATTITGTLSVSGSSVTRRVGFTSNIPATRTLTVATLSTDHCDFEDITLAGAASPASPTGAGDCGGNTNITFPAAKTVYRVGTDTTWAGSSSWATTSGGTGSNANFPLPQDTAIVDNATTGTSIVFANYNRGGFNLSTRTSAYTVSLSTAHNFYGDFILGSGASLTGGSAITYRGRGTATLNSAGKTFGVDISITSIGGTLQLGAALTSTNGLFLNNGTFDAGTYNVTLGSFSSSNSNVRTLNMGSGLWTITSTGEIWGIASSTNLTLNKGTADILFSSTSTASRIFNGGGRSYNKFTIGGTTGTSTLQIGGANTFTELASTKTVAHTIRFDSNTNGSTYGIWSVSGRSGGVVTVNSTTTGTRRTFNLTNVTSAIDFLAVQDIGVNQANTFYVGANSTNNGNNANVIFTAAPGGAAVNNFFLLF